MTNRVEGYIGCPECKTVLFRLESNPATNPGVRTHDKVNLNAGAGDGALHCPDDGCGAILTRVPAPKT